MGKKKNLHIVIDSKEAGWILRGLARDYQKIKKDGGNNDAALEAIRWPAIQILQEAYDEGLKIKKPIHPMHKYIKIFEFTASQDM